MAIENVRAMFPDVELVKVGTWQGVRGEVTITEEMLSELAESYDAEGVDHAPLKFGHFSDLGDGEPAPGWIENVRVSEDKTTLLGDIVDVPGSLVPLIETGYRRRSAEFKHNVKTASGKVHKHVLTGLALLGVKAPAVKGLKAMAATYLAQAQAAPDDETVVFLGEATRDTANVPHTGDEDRDDINNGSTSGTDKIKDKEISDMAFRDTLIAKLGLDKAATDDEIETALSEAEIAEPGSGDDADKGKAPAAPAPAAPAAPDTEGDEDEDKDKDKGPETVTVSKVKWEEITSKLDKLTEDAEATERDKLIETALSEGKIAPSETDQYVTLLSESPDAGKKLLSALPARYSTHQRGHGETMGHRDDAELKAMHAAADAAGI